MNNDNINKTLIRLELLIMEELKGADAEKRRKLNSLLSSVHLFLTGGDKH